MIKKSFITDCEGPLSLNDNAYELSKEFIPEGDLFFKIISEFDDYLVDIVKKPNYHAGDTLKLIVPFFKAYGLSNEDIISFSKKNIFLVNGAKDSLKLANSAMDSFIVSTSYGQYIEALCDFVDFPFKNTYYTKLDMDVYPDNTEVTLSDEEKEKLFDFKNKIIKNYHENYHKVENNNKNNNKNSDDKENNKNYAYEIEKYYNFLNDIFFNEIPKMEIAKLTESVKTVGGEGKKLAIDDIIATRGIDKNGIMYFGDSITDVEPLKFARENGGIAISFNGNEYALKNAEIAIISNHTIASSLLIELHSKFNKEYIFEFIRSYNKDPKRAFESFRFGYRVVEKFNEVFPIDDLEKVPLENIDSKNQNSLNLPIIKIIAEDNIEELIKLSKKMRKDIRGQDIGSLG